MDPKKLRNYKVEQEVRTDSINKNTENKDKVKVEKMKNKSESTANKNNIQSESTTSCLSVVISLPDNTLKS
jgi:uncharacterized membrane protein (DUF106 family)